MATGGQALNKAKGYAPAQKGGSNVADQIYGIPNAGTTGPNRTAGYQYKKGGATKKYQEGGTTLKDMEKQTRRDVLGSKSSKIGVGTAVAGMLSVGAKALGDKIKAKKEAKKAVAEKAKATPKAQKGGAIKEKLMKESSSKEKNFREPSVAPAIKDSVNYYRKEMQGMRTNKGSGPVAPGKEKQYDKTGKNLERQFNKNKPGYDSMGNKKAKFGSSVNVQRGYPGKIRSAGDQGYTAVGKREPARTKFAKGGFPDLTGDGKVTKADVLKGRGVIKKKGGSVKKK
jgi:hypothetical protein